MKTRKTMVERLKACHKKCGGYAIVVRLSEMLWKQCSIPRTMHTYRLKSARGEWIVKPVHYADGLWYIRKRGTVYPRETIHPLKTFYNLYTYDRAKTMSGSKYGRYVIGGMRNETV